MPRKMFSILFRYILKKIARKIYRNLKISKNDKKNLMFNAVEAIKPNSEKVPSLS